MRDMSFDVFALRKKTAIKILLKSLIWAFALFGALFIVLLVALLGLLKAPSSSVSVPDKAVVTINLDTKFGEIGQDSLLAEVAPQASMSFYELLSILDMAANDSRVKALAARIHSSDLGLAQKQELFQAILNFRSHGKKAYIFAPGFGNLGGGTSEYYLATAFDKITMLPNTDIGMTGIGAEVPFARNVLDKIGIYPEFYSRYEYKGGMASFTDKKVPPAFKQNMNTLLSGLNLSLLQGIWESRFSKASKEEVFALVDEAPIAADKALDKKLIDEIAYEGEWLDGIKKEYDAKAISIADYAANFSFNAKGQKLAVIFLEGVIEDESLSPFSGSEITASDVLSYADEIMKDKDIKGVLVRINSPGGSYNASQEIWHTLKRLKEEKKIPLYVSMGDYAASGGYFVALAGDKIFAVPTTLTGSIGVFGGKFVLQDLWKKLKINWEAFNLSENSGILSPNFKFNASQRKAFEASLDRVYQDFTAKVVAARKLSRDDIDSIARGRVWCGADAYAVRLVDGIGGLMDAFMALREKSGIGQDENFAVTVYPKPKTLQEKLAEFVSMSPLGGVKAAGENLGIDSEMLGMLQRLRHNAVLPPIILHK